MDEQALIQAALQGDMDAFNRLVLVFQDMVYNTAYRVVGEPGAAEDATQEAFISVYKKLHTYRGGSFKAWVLRIVTNACYDELRRRQRRPVTSLEPELDDGELMESAKWMVDDAPLPEDVLVKAELDQAIQHCIDALICDTAAFRNCEKPLGTCQEEAPGLPAGLLGTFTAPLPSMR